MMDDKRPSLLEKGGESAIPAPVVAPIVNPHDDTTKRRQRLVRAFKWSIFVILFFVYAVRWFSVHVEPDIEAEAAAWLANPFAPPHHSQWREGARSGEGHSNWILNGKAAEKLFLCVFASHSRIHHLLSLGSRFSVPYDFSVGKSL